MLVLRSLVILLFISVPASAQQALADSVTKILQQKNIHDTVRAYNMVMLAMYTEPIDIRKAHARYKEAVNFALSKKQDYYAAMALYYEATPYNFSGERSKQYDNLIRATGILDKLDTYKAKNELAGVYGALSGYYRTMEKYDSAVAASLKSIQIQEEIESYGRIVSSLLNLAMIYQQLKLPEKQKQYVDKGLAYARTSGKNDAMMLAYLQQAQYYTEVKDFSMAKKYADSSTAFFREDYDFSRKQNYFLIKAAAFQNVDQYDSAILYFEMAYNHASDQNSSWNMAEPLMQIGHIYLKKKNYADAENYLQRGLAIAEKDSIGFFMKEGYGTLSELYAATGKYQLAYELSLKHNNIKDSLLTEERRKFALELEKQYETEKKDALLGQQEKVIDQRKKLNIALGAAAVLLTIALLLSFRNYRHKQKIQMLRINELETEKKLTATEAVLKGEEQERARLAKDLHDGLSGMLSGVKYSFQDMKGNLIMTADNQQAFERSMDMLDSSIREMRRVAHNMMPEVLVRYGLDTALKDFTTEINKSKILTVVYQSMGIDKVKMEQSEALAVYRIVQELMNNVLKHAGATEALVQVLGEHDKLVVNVEDNGKGFDVNKTLSSAGMGWNNIRSRVELLKGTIDIHSEPGKGTAVNIELNTVS